MRKIVVAHYDMTKYGKGKEGKIYLDNGIPSSLKEKRYYTTERVAIRSIFTYANLDYRWTIVQ
jgi:hypothetical protein